MELLTCPACGCSVQVADALLGRRVRCIGCQHSFVAAARPAAPPARRETPPLPRYPAPLHPDDDDPLSNPRGPFCPGCGRPIRWKDAVCPHCNEELEPEDEARRYERWSADLVRRDYEPHRGSLILSLGNVSLILGGLAFCSFGFGALISVPLGVVVWAMANHDLERMREDGMDPRGKSQTQTGRAGAIAGVVLGLIFSAFYGLIYFSH